jgi:hypothetical protein
MRFLEFFHDPEDSGERPEDNYPCYDCGSTILGHHTKLCELVEDWAIRDLPNVPGKQWWTGEIPKGLKPIPGLENRGPKNNLKEAANPAQQAAIAIAMKKAGKKPKKSNESVNEGIDNFSLVHSAVKDLLPIAMSELKLKQLPKIHIKKTLDNAGQPSFGSFNGTDITLAVGGRHPVDICRTLAHELTHFAQGTQNKLNDESGRTGSPEENEANSMAGIIMRKFSLKHPEYMKNENQ